MNGYHQLLVGKLKINLASQISNIYLTSILKKTEWRFLNYKS
jgi:hypothetical protein